MSYSLGEVESTAKKAARGCGYTWGLAEEAARSTRWLCRQNLNGCAALARWLEQMDGSNLTDLTPKVEPEKWTSSGSILCPLIVGSALSDYATIIETKTIHLGRVSEPCLLFHAAGLMAQQLKMMISLHWPETTAVTDGERLSVDGAAEVASAQEVIVEFGGELGRLNELRSRANPTTTAWSTLERFASRTYAPATEESRLSGAGAGLSDND